jgi:hypothetical protein
MTTLQHKEPDCVPVSPATLLYGAAEMGMEIEQ